MITLRYTLDGETYTRELDDGVYTIGRKSSCELSIKDNSISGQHARLEIDGGIVFFEDLGSRNGTKRNGRKVNSGKLQPRDTLRLGRVDITVEFEGAEEETPPEGMMVPAVVKSTSAAVVVSRSGSASDMDETADASEAFRKKAIIGGAVGFGVIALAIILLIPAPPPPKKDDTPKIDYWAVLKKGEGAFLARKFKDAFEIWDKLDKDWSALKKVRPYRTAREYARVADSFVKAQNGKLENILWHEHSITLGDMIEMDDMHADSQRFATRMNAWVRREYAAQRQYEEAEELLENKEYEAAIAKFEEIDGDSLYHQYAEKNIAAAIDANFTEHRDKALAASRVEHWDEAVTEAKLALEIKEDAELQNNIYTWTENANIEKTVRRFKRQVDDNQFESAEETYRGLPEEVKQQTLIKVCFDKMSKGLELRRVQHAYAAWDTNDLQRLRDEIKGGAAEIHDIFVKTERLLSLIEKAKNAEDNNQLLTAVEYWNEMREIEPDATHPANLYAREKIEETTPERIGQAYKRIATDAFQSGEYRQAREALQTAELDGESNVTDEVDMIRRHGIKLYNKAVLQLSQNEFGSAKVTMQQALGCFLPGEEWYERIIDRMKKAGFSLKE